MQKDFEEEKQDMSSTLSSTKWKKGVTDELEKSPKQATQYLNLCHPVICLVWKHCDTNPHDFSNAKLF